jgi:hypothetical protein
MIKKAFRLGLTIDVKIYDMHSSRAPYPMPQIDAAISDGRNSGFIHGPSLPNGHGERTRECEDEMEGAVKGLIANAVRAGWTEAEVAAAISHLADHQMLPNDAMDKTAALFNAIKKRP